MGLVRMREGQAKGSLGLVGDEDPEEEWTDIEGVVSARAGWGRRLGGGCSMLGEVVVELTESGKREVEDGGSSRGGRRRG